MKCPNYKEVSLVMTERNGKDIAYCFECRSVWLDRGELDKIIERSIQYLKTSKDDIFYGKQYQSRNNEYSYKKRKDF